MDDALIRKIACESCQAKLEAALEHQKHLTLAREAQERLDALMGAVPRKAKTTKKKATKPKKPSPLRKAGGSRIPDKEVVRYINGRVGAAALAKKYKSSTQLVYVRAATMRKRFGVPVGGKVTAVPTKAKQQNGKADPAMIAKVLQ